MWIFGLCIQSLNSLPDDLSSLFLRFQKKNRSTSAGFQPANFGSRGKHVVDETTDADKLKCTIRISYSIFTKIIYRNNVSKYRFIFICRKNVFDIQTDNKQPLQCNDRKRNELAPSLQAWSVIPGFLSELTRCSGPYSTACLLRLTCVSGYDFLVYFTQVKLISIHSKLTFI